MPYLPGDHVHVASLGKGIVREVRNGDRYLVELKGRALVVDARQLTLVEGKRRKASAPPAVPRSAAGEPTRSAPASIDLHGMTTAEAVVALDAFLNDAILAAHPEARVIHGRSGGRLKAAVHARLKALTVVRTFRVDPSNPGVTIVTL
jgi:DNA mismatch repair protein MutS2